MWFENVSLVEKAGKLFVFGAGYYWFYIEAFEATTGRNWFRFASRYIDEECPNGRKAEPKAEAAVKVLIQQLGDSRYGVREAATRPDSGPSEPPSGALLELDKLVVDELLSVEEGSKDAVLRRRTKLARERMENRLGMTTVNGVRFAAVVPRQWAIPKDKSTIPLLFQATNLRDTPVRLNLLNVIQVEVRGCCTDTELSHRPEVCGTVVLPPKLETPLLPTGQTFTWWKIEGILRRGPPIEFLYPAIPLFGYDRWMGFSKGTYQVRLSYCNKDQPERYWVGDVRTPWIAVEIR